MNVQTLTSAGHADYDLPYEHVLVYDPDTMLGVLAYDSYCGEDTLDGGCYRQHLYYLTAPMTTELVANWDTEGADGDWWERWAGLLLDPHQGHQWMQPNAALAGVLATHVQTMTPPTQESSND